MRKLIFFFAGICLVNTGYSQNNTFNKPPVSFLSPDAASLGKYGTFNVNHYTGSPNITIPIYEIKESGLNIPISISYDASGFIPNKNAGVVGQNWNLTAGGAITRVVKGVPDDKNNPNPENNDVYTKDNKGYIYGMQNSSLSSHPLTSEIEGLQFLSPSASYIPGFPTIQSLPNGRQVAYEYNPDIFSFNFLGHSGTFVLGNDGEVKVNSDRRYKVDLQGVKGHYKLVEEIDNQVQNNNLNNYDFSTIIITSDDGYKFYFGGKLPSLEISFTYAPDINGNTYPTRNVDDKTGVINAWYLTKIECPNGDEVNFDYGTYSTAEQTVLRHLSGNTGYWANTYADFLDIRLFWKDYKVKYQVIGGSAEGNNPPTIVKSLIKCVYLRKIETKLTIATFTYSRRNEQGQNLFYSTQQPGISTPFADYVAQNYRYFTSKLDQISIRDKVGIARPIDDGDFLGAPLLNYYFTYQFYGSQANGFRLFLKELKFQPTNAKYIFDYWRTDDLKHPMVSAIDKWGFYNGQENDRLIGINGPVYGDPAEFETNFTYAGQNRTASSTEGNIGLIKSVLFPTGGKTEFEFEGHTFKKYLKRKVNATGGNSIIPEWVTLTQDEYGGGCRIKRITSSSLGTNTITTNYKYIKDYHLNANGQSSGLLLNYGVFRMRYERGNGHFHEQLFDDNIAASSGYGESPICYSEVVEISGDGSEGFSRYIYTNPDSETYPEPESSPDNYYNTAYGTSSFRIYGATQTVLSFMNQMKRLARYSSRSSERGKLWRLEKFGSNGSSLIMTQENIYNRDVNRFNEKTVGYERVFTQQIPDNSVYADFGFFIQSFHIYHYHNNPSQVITKTFANGQVLTETTSFTYKSNSNPLLTEKTTTRSDGTVYKTQYFYAEDRVGNPEFSFSAGMVNRHMVSTVVEEKNFMNAVPLTTNKYIYADINGNGSYKPVQTFSLDHTIAGAVQEEGLNISYYTDGTVKESLKKHDLKFAYIWDYLRLFPVAEVKNVQDASDIAFTSFETTEPWATGGYNQWLVSNLNAALLSYGCPTGSKAFNLNHNNTSQQITRSISPGKDYVVSLWVKGGTVDVSGLTAVSGLTLGPWTYKEYAVSGLSTLTITGTGWIDELRLYPKGAQMTTYTYQPLHGITTICDPNNRINYYIYDLSGRLTMIRDKDFNIVKKICYNYSGQPVNCSNVYLRNVETSEVFYKNDCPAGYEGGPVTYTIPANTYASNVDQADANWQAQRDITLNGQAYANSNGACICTVNSCTGEDKKCINGVCETGQKKYIAATYIKATGLWACVYVYEWSDCTLSQQYSETSSTACTVTPTCLDY